MTPMLADARPRAARPPAGPRRGRLAVREDATVREGRDSKGGTKPPPPATPAEGTNIMHRVTMSELEGAVKVLGTLLPYGAGLCVQGGGGCRITSADGSREYTPRGTKRATYTLAWAMIKAIQLARGDD